MAINVPISNYFKSKWIKFSIKRHTEAKRIRKQDPDIFCLQDTHFRPKDTHRLKVKGWKKNFMKMETNKQTNKSWGSNTLT